MKTNTPPFGRRTPACVLCCLIAVLFPLSSAKAATFPGNARVEIADPTGGLSWSNSVGALTVQCWFKISIPSGFAPTENMTILVNRTSGTIADPHAYHLWYDKTARNIQFSTRGTNLWQHVLIPKPYLDRWYHVAVVRSGNFITAAYVDGQSITLTNNSGIGDSRSTSGVSIGGWGNSKHLYGEVQEVSIYQTVLDPSQIFERLFTDQPIEPGLLGYYKLGYSTNEADFLRNFAFNKPPGTDPAVKQGAGQILFEETNQKGEQSLFDSQVSGGKNAVVPLSGAFTWQQKVFGRPLPGVPFDFTICYSPAGGNNNLGPGWNHSLSPRVITEGSTKEWKLLTWQGGIETFDRTNTASPFSTRHGEYRGELVALGSTEVEWTTPQRIVHRFLEPGNPAQSTMAGRLTEIRDFNTNSLTLQWNTSQGYITNVADSAGGNYRFFYNAQKLLTNVLCDAWQVFFTYSNVAGADRLVSKSITNTSGVYSNVNTTLRFYYNANGLLERIEDSRGNTNVIVRYDEYGRRTNIVDALGQTTRIEYGIPDSRQITTTDPEGFKWIETYDRKGRVIARKNPLGNETHSAYDEHGNLISSTDALGNLTLMAYDERANATAVTNALGEVTRQTYHSFFNKPVTQTDPLGWTTTNSYDARGNLLTQSDALGTLAAYTYRTNGLIETQTDANGSTTRFGYNTNGVRVAETNAAGFSRYTLPNDVGWPLAITNALGEIMIYAYDLNGKTVRTVDQVPRVFTGVYDANGNLLRQTDAKGQTATNYYDALNQKTIEVDRSGATNRYVYTKRGKLAAMTNALGYVTTLNYDSANRQITQVDALGNSQRTIYDANGNVVATIDELGQRWTKSYDSLNRVVAESDPFGNTMRTAYDPAGRVWRITSPQGATTTQAYDGRGRMSNRVDAAGGFWLYACDGVGNITNITDAKGGRYVMTYGSRNERLLERNQDGKTWTYTYDALGRLKTQTEPNNTTRTNAYDAGSRVESVTFNNGRVNSFGYDLNDNPVFLTRSGSGPLTTSQLTYDALDRVQQYTDAFSKTVRYTYDRGGRLEALTYPDNKVLTNRYDQLDRLTNQVFHFSALKTFTNSYAYDKAGRVIRRVYPNGIVQTNGFDNAGRLSALSHSPLTPQPSKLNIAFNYAYDRNGNATVAQSQGVFQWPVPTLLDETSRFTPAGQITNRVDALNPVPNSFIYRYDARGNMTNCAGAAQSWTLTYDEDNRSTSIVWTNDYLNDVVIANRYDALGRRISRTEDGTLTGYVLDLAGDMERILCDLDAFGSITAYYVHGFDLTFKVSPDESLICYHADAHGNVIALTDATANTIAEYAYTPYGRSLASSATSTQPYRFSGSQGVMEELPGLYFMRARYYSAEAGVFLSTDPVQNIGPSWLPIAYVYGECNPLRFNDPKGEFWDFGLSVLIGTVGGAIAGLGIDLAIQGVEIALGKRDAINWKQAGGAAAAGAITGFVAGLSVSLPGAGTAAGLALAAGVNALGGMAATVASSAIENGNLSQLKPGELIAGGVMGGLGAVGGAGVSAGARRLTNRMVSKLGNSRTYAWSFAEDNTWATITKYGTKTRGDLMNVWSLRRAKLDQAAIEGAAWGVGEAGLATLDYFASMGFNKLFKPSWPWD